MSSAGDSTQAPPHFVRRRILHEKVEKITLPDGYDHVDVIISEWMGYALLYESMLDSVLHARNRFLRPGGLIAPSQARMKLALCEAAEIYKERVEFWSDIYGNHSPFFLAGRSQMIGLQDLIFL